MCASTRLANKVQYSDSSNSMYNNEVMNFHVCICRSKNHQLQCVWVLDLPTARYSSTNVHVAVIAMQNFTYKQNKDDFVLHTGSKITNGHAYSYSACQQQGIVLHVTVIQLLQCVVLFCVQMQNLDPVNMDEENAEVINSLEVRLKAYDATWHFHLYEIKLFDSPCTHD